MAVKKDLYPRDLESIYSQVFGELIRDLNKSYLFELRKALKEDFAQDIQVLNALEIYFLTEGRGVINSGNVFVTNATAYQKTAERLKKLREKIFNKKLFKDTLTGMNNVLDRLVGRAIRGINKQLESKNLPRLKLKADIPALKVAIDRNVNLITAITEAQANQLEQAVLKSVKGGSSPNTIIEEVKKISDNGEAYAEFVARDQLAKAQADINQDAQRRAGFPGYIWRITGDTRVRPDHRKQADRFFLWNDPPLLDNGNLHPGEDYQCRCIAEPAFSPE